MTINIQSINFTADGKLIDFAKKKIEKLEQFYDKILSAEVVFKSDDSVGTVVNYSGYYGSSSGKAIGILLNDDVAFSATYDDSDLDGFVDSVFVFYPFFPFYKALFKFSLAY